MCACSVYLLRWHCVGVNEYMSPKNVLKLSAFWIYRHLMRLKNIPDIKSKFIYIFVRKIFSTFDDAYNFAAIKHTTEN